MGAEARGGADGVAPASGAQLGEGLGLVGAAARRVAGREHEIGGGDAGEGGGQLGDQGCRGAAPRARVRAAPWRAASCSKASDLGGAGCAGAGPAEELLSGLERTLVAGAVIGGGGVHEEGESIEERAAERRGAGGEGHLLGVEGDHRGAGREGCEGLRARAVDAHGAPRAVDGGELLAREAARSSRSLLRALRRSARAHAGRGGAVGDQLRGGGGCGSCGRWRRSRWPRGGSSCPVRSGR